VRNPSVIGAVFVLPIPRCHYASHENRELSRDTKIRNRKNNGL